MLQVQQYSNEYIDIKYFWESMELGKSNSELQIFRTKRYIPVKVRAVWLKIVILLFKIILNFEI